VGLELAGNALTQRPHPRSLGYRLRSRTLPTRGREKRERSSFSIKINYI
jgi:hypothetical protein